MLVPGSRTDRSRALGALTLVLAAFALWASAATGSTYAIVASTNVQTTTLANDVLPDLGSYTDLGPVAAGQRLQVDIRGSVGCRRVVDERGVRNEGGVNERCVFDRRRFGSVERILHWSAVGAGIDEGGV